MKITRVFALLSAAVLAFSCAEKNGPEVAQLPAPVLVAEESTETSVSATWTEIPGADSYAVQFDSDDVFYTEITGFEWMDLERNSAHTLKVKALSADESEFKDSEWSKVLVLRTLESGDVYTPFKVSVDNVTFYDAHLKIDAGEYAGDYFVVTTPKASLDSDEFYGNVETFASAYMATMKDMVDQGGDATSDWYDVLKYNGSLTATIPNLAPSAEYVVLVFGTENDWSITTGITSVNFTTEKDPGVEPSKMTFDIQVEKSSETRATVTVTPSVDDEYYFYTAINKARFDDMGGDSDDAIINYWLKIFAQYLGDEDFEDYAKDNFAKGKDSYLYSTLEENADYVVIAFGVTWHGNACVATTGLTRSEFQTGAGAQGPGEENIEFVINKLTSTDIEVTYVPSDKSLFYVWDFVTYADYKALTDEEVMAKFIEERGGSIMMTTTRGPITYKNVNDLIPGKEYAIFAFYVDESSDKKVAAVPHGKLYKQIVVAPTDGGDTPVKPTISFTISEDEVTENSLKATVTPSDASAKYIAYVLEAAKYEDATDEEMIKAVTNALGYDIIGSERTGVSTITKSKLNAETGYYVVVFGVDGNYNATTGVTRRMITTKHSSATAPTEGIVITLKEKTSTKILASIDAADQDMSLLVNLYKAETLKDLSDGEIISKMLEDADPYELYYEMLPKGHTNLIRDAVTAGTDYVIVACGVKGQSSCTGLYRLDVTTPAN